MEGWRRRRRGGCSNKKPHPARFAGPPPRRGIYTEFIRPHPPEIAKRFLISAPALTKSDFDILCRLFAGAAGEVGKRPRFPRPREQHGPKGKTNP
jgi:hypothetical protein